uniref:Uncharacterized protein n=1 Tax=Arundo donax TaxID=35708 RepID=A0A0A9B4M1_ARUDO
MIHSSSAFSRKRGGFGRVYYVQN